MTNAELASVFSALAKLLEYHGENVFKIRSYATAADVIRKGNVAFGALDRAELLATEGIGKAIADKILELGETGQLELYARTLDKTPSVVPELLSIKGVGVKKVRQLVEELGIQSVGELRQAIDENRVVELRGFSTKTQDKLRDQLAFHESAKGRLRYADAIRIAGPLLDGFRQNARRVAYTGALRRQCNVVETLDFLAVADDPFYVGLTKSGYTMNGSDAAPCYVSASGTSPVVRVFATSAEDWGRVWCRTTGAEEYLSANPGLVRQLEAGTGAIAREETVFANAGLPYCPAPQRELESPAPPTPAGEVITPEDIRGVVHAHTTASDGSASLEVLAKAARERGYTYLTVTDHSRAAGYANGLSVERLRRQAVEIDDFNALHPELRVFKGTECDILRDGRLDYPDDVLAELDIVIASVHSVLTMGSADATARLLRAISNPYVTMLGHPTGRLLLSREGYAPDMTAVLEACAEHEVAIEINASPMRLDLDWRYVPLAVELGVKISINPDAHSTLHLDNTRFGVYAAQKAGLRPEDCLNCLGADEFAGYLAARRRRRVGS